MKKSFVFSFSIALILLLAGYFTEYTRVIGSVSFGLAIIFLAIGSLAGNTFVGGSDLQPNLATESKEDRVVKKRVLFKTVIIAIPLFIIGAILLSI